MEENANIVEQLSDRARKDRDRPLHVYNIPDAIKAEVGISQVGMVVLRTREELDAARRCQKPTELAYEYIKESLRMVDGKRVRTSDGSADSVWNSMHPKVRQLLANAYNALHNPEGKEVNSFLESHEVQVG